MVQLWGALLGPGPSAGSTGQAWPFSAERAVAPGWSTPRLPVLTRILNKNKETASHVWCVEHYPPSPRPPKPQNVALFGNWVSQVQLVKDFQMKLSCT